MTTNPPEQPGDGWPSSGQPPPSPPPPPSGAPGTPPPPGGQPGYSAPPGAQPGYGQQYGGGYIPPGQPTGDPNAPYGYDPVTGLPYSDKQKLLVGLLNILLAFGVGRMYGGHVGIGVAQLIVTIVTCGLGSLWSIIDGILILVNGGTDGEGRPLRP